MLRAYRQIVHGQTGIVLFEVENLTKAPFMVKDVLMHKDDKSESPLPDQKFYLQRDTLKPSEVIRGAVTFTFSPETRKYKISIVGHGKGGNLTLSRGGIKF